MANERDDGSSHPRDDADASTPESPGIMPPPAHSAGVLVDWQINAAVRDEDLITEAFDESSSRYATYEVHASSLTETLTHTDGSTAHVRRIVRNGQIWIRSRETVKIYTAEVINLKANMYATVTGLGQLYACGLTIGSTYIDPGSQGAVYLAVTNISDHEIGIPVGSPIARVQFWRLGDVPASKHLGHQARRRIELDVRQHPEQESKAVSREADPESLAAMALRSSRLEAALVIQSFVTLGLFWYTNPAAFAGVLRFVAGDDLPPLAHFLVPAIAGPVLFFAIRWLWGLVRPGLTRRR